MRTRTTLSLLAMALLAGCTTNFDVRSLPATRPVDAAMDSASDASVMDAVPEAEAAAPPDVTPAESGAECAPGETRCGGACVSTQSSAMHCGACNRACAAPMGGMPANATLACVAGSCALQCAPGFADCNGSMADGCEVNTNDSAMHCGRCGNVCAAGANGAAACSAGMCDVRCNANFGNCDGDRANGCETDLRTNVNHCLRCGNMCPRPLNARALCDAARDAMGLNPCDSACTEGYGDCDDNAATGCEQRLSNPMHCGACNMRCAANQVCSRNAMTGVYACASGCAAGQANCNGACVDTLSDPDNCGGCGVVCPALAGSERACNAGRCGSRCAAGFGDCDGNAMNGCETDLRSSAMHCGACGAACAPANAAGTCSAGACAVATCNAGFADCNSRATDGCETSLGTSVDHCGRCNNRCSGNNLPSPTCAMGACGGACAAGFGDCNGDRADGCETALSTAMNCGACGTACATGQVCAPMGTGFSCQTPAMSCGAGQMLCGAVCATLATDTANCGRCGNACPSGANATATCMAGACGLRCADGFADCDGNPANGCEANVRTSAQHCGACNRACEGSPALGTAAECRDGACQVTCQAGRLSCDSMNPSDMTGCEVDPQVTDEHCGRCGNACAAGQNCIGGACVCPGSGTLCGTGAMAACVELQSDSNNCGSCGNVCPAGVGCVSGTCPCPDGQFACGGMCINTSSDVNNCGSCNNRCPAGSMCVSGVCQCPGATPTQCGSACVDLQTNAMHCGACGNACPAGRACVAGVCQCGAGETRCGSGTAAMCVNTQTSPTNCGTCSNVCPTRQNSSPTCASGTCSIACAMGFANCNARLDDGCEINTTTNVNHCGRCGNVCPDPPFGVVNATKRCMNSACGWACTAGYGNCDGNNNNGCETDLRVNSAHCGACGRACGAGEVCVSGSCRACPAGYTPRSCSLVQYSRCCMGGTTCLHSSCMFN